jgi:tetratricopeptide (TPR) repeat protein
MSGLLAKLFPSIAGPEAKLAKARRLLESGDFSEARWLILDLEHPEAATVLAQARDGLLQANLDEARAQYSAGNRTGGEEHLVLAREFGATSEQCRDARQLGRADAPAVPIKPPPPPPAPIEGGDPLWSLPPDDPRLRYAVLIEAYPEALRDRLIDLGADFAAAVLRIDDGHPKDAYTALTPFIERDEVVRYERARAALAATKLPAAASDLMRFGDVVGHQRIGATHTAVLMAQILISMGRASEALRPIEACREASTDSGEQHVLDAIRARLLTEMGDLDEADILATRLVRTAPRDMGVIRLLAQIRLGKGERPAAMSILEDGLNRCCSSPGRCGNQPLDVEAARTLARLYLEDRIEPKRTSDLLGQLARNVPQPTWEDRYLAALVARNEGQPHARDLVHRLTAELKENDGRRQRLSRAFPTRTSA